MPCRNSSAPFLHALAPNAARPETLPANGYIQPTCQIIRVLPFPFKNTYPHPMKTREFLELLNEHPNRSLEFEYRPGSRLLPGYHITEVKNLHIDATDCGGRTDSWQETVIQLWENPAGETAPRSITARKALAILDRVNRSQPLLPDSPLKFEYGNADFHTAQLHVTGIFRDGEALVVALSPERTHCKASDQCGVAEPKSDLSACCEPGTGCC